METLSLEAKEIELIIKSLEKNKGKRKAAADELGISERTLYRKIKHKSWLFYFTAFAENVFKYSMPTG